MNIFNTIKLANSIDFEKLGDAIPKFILKKIHDKFKITKNVIEKDLLENEQRAALMMYEDAAGKLCGLWVTIDKNGVSISRKVSVQEIESLAADKNSDVFSMLPEIMKFAGQEIPDELKQLNNTTPNENENDFGASVPNDSNQ